MEIHHRASARKCTPASAITHEGPEFRVTNRATRRIAGQFGLSIHHAAAIAHLAGLGSEVAR
jgi:hypothetical protein